MIGEWERIWKEALVFESTSYPVICLERLRRTKEYLSEDGRYSDLGSNRALSGYRYARQLCLHFILGHWYSLCR
jgi:hypothetical protein